MERFRTLSFVVFDEKGEPHRVQMDKFGGAHPDYQFRGDAAVLLEEWQRASRLVELYLSAHQHEWGFRHAEMGE